jgi:hypothetical protein
MIEGGDSMAGILAGVRARRIVACVNACKGLSTKMLENVNPKKMLEFAEKTHRGDATT